MIARVLLVDDHAVVREGWQRILERTDDIVVIAEATSGEDACGLYDASAPDVVIVDFDLPGMTGLETTRRLLARDPDALILLSGVSEDAGLAARALQAGARGYVTKSNTPDILVQAVRTIATGHQYISHDMAQRLALQAVPGQKTTIDSLSPREFEVFHLLAEGKTVSDIAGVLSLSQKTVANYQSSIRQKLEANSSAQMVWIALRRSMVGKHEG